MDKVWGQITLQEEAAKLFANVYKDDAVVRFSKETREEIEKIKGLSDNWDGYGSPKPTQNSIDSALLLLRKIYLVPISGGAIQLEIHDNDAPVVEIFIDNDGSVSVCGIEELSQAITRKEERVAELEAVLGDLLDEGERYSFEHFGKWQSLGGTDEFEAARKSLGENNE